MINIGILSGFKVVIPSPRKKMFKYEWYESLRTFIKTPYVWIDSLEMAIYQKSDNVIVDEINKVIYMSATSADRLRKEIKSDQYAALTTPWSRGNFK